MFKNRIRLPFYIKNPQFPTEANRFRMANGTTKTLSVVIRKTYQLETDYMGEKLHQQLVIALNHDEVTIEGDKYIGDVVMDGEYVIEPVDFLDYPLGKGGATIQVTPFDATNDNCQSCDALTQLSLEDDEVGEIEEGGIGSVNAYTNDSICCFPITAEIVSFASGYLDSATIEEATGVVTLTAKDPVASVGNIVLATYRVTCPDGTYDEADIYGSIVGSEVECEQPTVFERSISVDGPPFEITVTWDNPAVPAADGYEWILYEASNPGVPIDSGTTAINAATFDVDAADTGYIFSVRSVCSEGVYSPYSNYEFTSPEGGGGGSDCGSYSVTANDGTIGTSLYSYTFMQCDGNLRTRYITNLQTRIECMLTQNVNEPVYFNTTGPVTYEYESVC